MNSNLRNLTVAGLGAGAILGAGVLWRTRGRARPSELNAVGFVDLERYAGRWFEIAHYPTRFQRECEKNTTAEYTPRGHGRILVENRCTTADGRTVVARAVAKVTDEATNAKLKVRFGPFMPAGDYWIVDLDPDYRWAVVGEPKRRFLWVLSRTPALDPKIYEDLCARLRRQDYDPELLVPTKQDGA